MTIEIPDHLVESFNEFISVQSEMYQEYNDGFMKNLLDFYFNEFVSEWDEEFAQLVIDTSIENLSEHRQVVTEALIEVLIQHNDECWLYSKKDRVSVLSVLTWLNNL